MALIENVFGMNGKFGDWVMCRRGGKTYVKRRTKIQAPATEMQEAARRRWKATVRFYQQLPTEAREFLNRVDDIVVFQKLTGESLTAIAELLVDDLRQRLEGRGLRTRMERSGKLYLVLVLLRGTDERAVEIPRIMEELRLGTPMLRSRKPVLR